MPATKEEQDIINKYGTEVSTYHDEMSNKFITGQEPIENFDTYVANMQKLGLGELTKVRQQQYERFLKLSGK